ncbi:MAG: hypothetical protein KTU85_07380 [Acidimicrobiia bacterium]|nr:hypothetical protein [Acidimicrobiia bacterium]
MDLRIGPSLSTEDRFHHTVLNNAELRTAGLEPTRDFRELLAELVDRRT